MVFRSEITPCFDELNTLFSIKCDLLFTILFWSENLLKIVGWWDGKRGKLKMEKVEFVCTEQNCVYFEFAFQ